MYLGEHLHYLNQVIFTGEGAKRSSTAMISHILGYSIAMDSLLNYVSNNLLPFTPEYLQYKLSTN